jgi:serine/threonine protein kinase
MTGSFTMTGPVWTKVSADGKSFISELMRVDPTTRLTAVGALRHPWLSSIAEVEDRPPAKLTQLDPISEESTPRSTPNGSPRSHVDDPVGNSAAEARVASSSTPAGMPPPIAPNGRGVKRPAVPEDPLPPPLAAVSHNESSRAPPQPQPPARKITRRTSAQPMELSVTVHRATDAETKTEAAPPPSEARKTTRKTAGKRSGK